MASTKMKFMPETVHHYFPVTKNRIKVKFLKNKCLVRNV